MKPLISQLLKPGGYYGRVLCAGQTEGQKIFFLYGITGRSPSSRARRLVLHEEGIFTEPIPKLELAPGAKELLIYPAIIFSQGIAASNGQQTKDIAFHLAQGLNDPVTVLQEALQVWDYEPDSPIFTPRISACLTINGRLAMSVIRRGEDGQSIREFYPLSLEPGQGFLLATYDGENKNPPASFLGPPRVFRTLSLKARELVEEFYENLQPEAGKEDLRVAAAALTFLCPGNQPDEIEIINRYEEQEERK